MFKACAFALLMLPFTSFAQNTVPEHPPAFIPPSAYNQTIPSQTTPNVVPANPNIVTPAVSNVPAVANDTFKVNINTADATTLDAVLTGIGAKKAQAIVQYRQEFGAFKSPYELTKVHGIGEKTVESNLNKIVLTDELPIKETTDKTTEVSNVIKR